MTYHSNTTTFKSANGTERIKSNQFLSSTNSSRVNGKLILRPNALYQSKLVNESYLETSIYAPLADPLGQAYFPIESGESQHAETSAYNKAYGSWRGRLHKGGASLGVTIASYKQSREMIVDRATRISRSIDGLNRRLSSDGRVRAGGRMYVQKGKRQSAASAVLETVFGWQPLLQDIFAAAFTVIQQSPRQTSIVGRGTGNFSQTLEIWDQYGGVRGSAHGSVKFSVASIVTVSNPNLWLLNRAGLVNPFAVAWDLVPWSFVVNMFVNVNAVVGSLTDTVGLNVDYQSVTRTTKQKGSYQLANIVPGVSRESTLVNWSGLLRSRSVGSIPPPSFELRLPNANMSLATIAMALVTQKIRKLDRFLSI